MSEEVNKNNDDGQKGDTMDSTSFASILAGVKRMRQEAGGMDNHSNNEEVGVDGTSVGGKVASTVDKRPNRIEEANGETSAKRQTREANITRVQQRSNRPIPATRVSGPSEILVHKSQRGNPLFENSLMKYTPWAFDESVLSDYYINPTLQILFLSLKYFKLHPEYIWQRLKKINKGSSLVSESRDRVLRILLVVVDIDSHQEILCNLSHICVKHDLSLVLSWSFEEAGNYIVFAKQLDNAPSKRKAAIEKRRATDFNTSVVDAFTTIRSVNKTDVSNMLANFKSVKSIVEKTCSDDANDNLSNINGLGATKIKNMKRVFSEPFIYNNKYDKD